jgi:hypothetical protein
MPKRSRGTYEKAAQVVSKMRAERISLRQAARDLGVRPETVLRWGKSGLKKTASGRYEAKRTDPMFRELQVVTEMGKQAITVKGFP